MNHEGGTLFHPTLPNTAHLARTPPPPHRRTLRCRTSLSPSCNWWRALYRQIDFPYSEIIVTQERRRRRKDAVINNFMFQSAYLSRTKKESQSLRLLFLSWNVADYHETHELNFFFIKVIIDLTFRSTSKAVRPEGSAVNYSIKLRIYH